MTLSMGIWRLKSVDVDAKDLAKFSPSEFQGTLPAGNVSSR